MSKLRKIIFIALLASAGMGLGVVESAIPIPIPLPGARLGLSNMVILITLIVFGFKEAITVSALKSILLMLVTGSVTGFAYSFAGAILSSVGMALAFRFIYPHISLIGVSLIGAALHNVAQVTVAVAILGKWQIYIYLAPLLLLGIATGFFVGLASSYVVEHMKKGPMVTLFEEVKK